MCHADPKARLPLAVGLPMKVTATLLETVRRAQAYRTGSGRPLSFSPGSRPRRGIRLGPFPVRSAAHGADLVLPKGPRVHEPSLGLEVSWNVDWEPAHSAHACIDEERW